MANSRTTNYVDLKWNEMPEDRVHERLIVSVVFNFLVLLSEIDYVVQHALCMS